MESIGWPPLWTQLNDIGPPPSDYPALVATGRGSILFSGISRLATAGTDG